MTIIDIFTPLTIVGEIDTTNRLQMLHALDREPTAEELSDDQIAAGSLAGYASTHDNIVFIGSGQAFETMDEYLEGAEDGYKALVLDAVKKIGD